MKMNKLGCDVSSSCSSRHEDSVSMQISFAIKKKTTRLFTLTRMSKNCSCIKVQIFDKKCLSDWINFKWTMKKRTL